MKPKLVTQLDLPPIPDHLLDWTTVSREFFSIEKDIDRFNYGRDHYWQGQLLDPPSFFTAKITWPPLTQWISDILYGQQLEVHVSHNVITSHNQGRMIIHSDTSRCAALQYIIDTGGQEVYTNFYQEVNKPLHRGRKPHKDCQSDEPVVRYDDVVLLDRICMQPQKWYIFRSDVLHDVSNLTGSRSHISVSFFETSFFEAAIA